MFIRDSGPGLTTRGLRAIPIAGAAMVVLIVFLQFPLLTRTGLRSPRPSEHWIFSLATESQSIYISYSNFRVRYRVRVRDERANLFVRASSSPAHDSPLREANLSTEQPLPPQPPPVTYPICLAKSEYQKAFGTLSFPQANQLPVYSWDGGPGCPAGKKAGGNAPGTAGGAAKNPLVVAIDELWTTRGAKLLPPPVGSFDPPTAITGARVFLVSRSLPSVSLDLAFHGAELAFHATSELWVQWGPSDPVAGPFPVTSSGWPNGAIHHTYSEPGQREVEVTERWQVVWSFDGHTGVLPAVVRTATLPLQVQTLRRILLAPA